MLGVISRVIYKREEPGRDSGGYGFIVDENGDQRFFHARDLVVERDGELVPAPSRAFAGVREGAKVAFEPRTVSVGKGNGLRAERVRLV